MRNYLALIMLLVSTAALANGPWDIKQQNIKLPSQAVLEHHAWAAPALGATTTLKNNQLVNGSPVTVSSFAAQPDYPRNITITPGGTTGNVLAGTVVVSGLNILGRAITENISISDAQSSTSLGSKAFKSVSSVALPATSGSGANFSIGVGAKLGLLHCVSRAGDYVFSEFGSVYDSSRGTLAANSSAVESNTFASSSALNGSSNVDIFYIQNFRCY